MRDASLGATSTVSGETSEGSTGPTTAHVVPSSAERTSLNCAAPLGPGSLKKASGACGALRDSVRSLTDLPAKSGIERNVHPSVVAAKPSNFVVTVVPFAVTASMRSCERILPRADSQRHPNVLPPSRVSRRPIVADTTKCFASDGSNAMWLDDGYLPFAAAPAAVKRSATASADGRISGGIRRARASFRSRRGAAGP
jgi:hypothetical protein